MRSKMSRAPYGTWSRIDFPVEITLPVRAVKLTVLYTGAMVLLELL